jgi:hypothetical protein
MLDFELANLLDILTALSNRKSKPLLLHQTKIIELISPLPINKKDLTVNNPSSFP